MGIVKTIQDQGFYGLIQNLVAPIKAAILINRSGDEVGTTSSPLHVQLTGSANVVDAKGNAVPLRRSDLYNSPTAFRVADSKGVTYTLLIVEIIQAILLLVLVLR